MEQLLAYYKNQGAPADQTALVNLLKELQQIHGAVPRWAVQRSAQYFGLKESFLLAIIKRIPSLRLEDTHLLELCAGANCGKHTKLAETAGKLCKLKGVSFRYMGCQRMCGKGPNLRYDGKLYHRADKQLLETLLG